MKILLSVVLLVLLLPTGALAAGEAWDSPPALPPGEPLALTQELRAEGIETDGLSTCLRSLNATSEASTFAALVNLSAADGSPSRAHRDAGDYADALYDSWSATGRIDPQTQVILVAGLRNRSLGIHLGSRWVDLGFWASDLADLTRDQYAVERLADGDGAAALCVLAQAVDARLRRLLREAPARQAAIGRELLAVASSELLRPESELNRRLQRLDDLSPNLASGLRQRVSAAKGELRTARSDWRRQRSAQAESALAAARESLRQATLGLEKIEGRHQLLAAFDLTLRDQNGRALRARKATGPEFQEIQREIEQCRQIYEKAQGDLLQTSVKTSKEPGNLSAEDTRIGHRLERCLSQVEGHLTESELRYRLQRVVLPRIILSLVALALLLAVIAHQRRRLRLALRVSEDLLLWRSQLDEIDRLHHRLESEHCIFLAAGRQPWSGESREVELRFGETIADYQRLRERANARWNEAESKVAGSGLWSLDPLQEAGDLLRQSSIQALLGPGGSPTAGSEDLDYAKPPLLAALRQAQEQSKTVLREMRRQWERAVAACLRAGELMWETLAEIEKRSESGLSALHLSDPFEQELKIRRQGDDLLFNDPLRAGELLDRASRGLAALRDQARRGNTVIDQLRRVNRARIAALELQAKRLRSAGYRLQEPGFDPNIRLFRLRRQVELAEAALGQGQEAQAEALAASLQPGMDYLAEQLSASADAKDVVAAALPGLERRQQELGERLPEAEATLERSKEDFASALLDRQAESVDRLREELSQVPGWLRHVAEEHGRERYLSALAELAGCDELLLRGLRLLDEVADVERRLTTARKASLATSRRSEELLARIFELAGADGPGIGVQLRAEVTAYRTRAKALLEAVQSKQPDWLYLESSLVVLNFELLVVLRSLEGELEQCREGEELARGLGQELTRLGQELAFRQRQTDLQRAVLSEARHQLGVWREELRQPFLSGRELLCQGALVENTLAWAQEINTSPEPVATLAQRQLRAADAQARALHGRSCGMGVRADCSVANGVLKEARELAQKESWPEALALAKRSQGLVQAETIRIRSRIDQLEDAERRRLAALREGARQESRRRAALGDSIARSWVREEESDASSTGKTAVLATASSFGPRTLEALLGWQVAASTKKAPRRQGDRVSGGG